jgi:hypothetical protein
VAVELDAGGQPVAVGRSRGKGGGQGGQKANSAVRAVVETVLESWCIDDEWWRQPISRRYFEVVLEDGGRVVLFEDLLSGEWFVQTA